MFYFLLKVRARELQDNIKFVENQERISKLDENISEIRGEQERVGDINQLRRLIKLISSTPYNALVTWQQ